MFRKKCQKLCREKYKNGTEYVDNIKETKQMYYDKVK